jgi:hypothetical protein
VHFGCKADDGVLPAFSSATRLGSRLLFLAEFLESGIGAQPAVSVWSDFDNRHHQSGLLFGEARLPVHVNIARRNYAQAS